ncbi:MAG: cupin domain-containing protein [Saccharolobus sp.]|uniref:(R)-mandelonitrile lyase n=1 Tax=Saccharolobus TaxID=2100760 RepID=UPI001F0F1336|nr:cupin domain-containing protein [Saccharolobus shibatae]MCH4816629.1 cupin domain-containing protein [Saccharolobus shibatae]
MDLIIRKNGTIPFTKGDPKYFTGNVIVEQLYEANEPSRVSSAVVTFEPGGRTNWHYHPLGQLLVVIYGTGLIQTWGSPPRKIKAGDVIWTPPNVKHWHGATATTAMTHIAIQEKLNGKTVEWLEKVSDKEYEEAQSASD